MTTKDNKQNFVAHEKFYGGKIVSPHQMLTLLRKNQHNRMWILKQLSQLGINVKLLEDYSLSDLYKHCDQIIKSTYSIKYLGMNENQMGIISRRIDPFKDNVFNLKELPQSTYTVNKFFFPKPLKVGRRQKKEEPINIDNLQVQIKKAFLKNNPSNSKYKNRLKNSVNGSWINDSIRKKGHKEDDKEEKTTQCKSFSNSKHLTKSDKGDLFEAGARKMSASYSRFLSSGLVFSSSLLNTS